MVARAQLGVNQLSNMAKGDPRRNLPESSNNGNEMQPRYNQSASKGKEVTRAPQLPSAKPAAGGVGGGGGFGGVMPNTAGPSAKTNADSYLREYAYRGAPRRGLADLQDTLLWSPAVFGRDGQAEVSFKLSQNQTSYRILIYANSPTGRLGFYEGRLEVKPGSKK
jgi:hypothetical protein